MRTGERLSESQFRAFAVAGARVELVRVSAERDRILTLFPELLPEVRAEFTPAPAPPPPPEPEPEVQITRFPRKRKRRTLKQRRLISRRMRAYWAKRRASASA